MSEDIERFRVVFENGGPPRIFHVCSRNPEEQTEQLSEVKAYVIDKDKSEDDFEMHCTGERDFECFQATGKVKEYLAINRRLEQLKNHSHLSWRYHLAGDKHNPEGIDLAFEIGAIERRKEVVSSWRKLARKLGQIAKEATRHAAVFI